jgi:hypothetical protein
MSKQTCSTCGTPVASYDGVSVGYKEGTKFLCSRCYNESLAEHLGLDYKHVRFDPLTLQDLEGYPHTFEFRSHLFGDQLSLDAFEVGPEQGYEFSVIADAEQDLFVTFQTLFERMRRALGRRHIEPEGEAYRITQADVVRGQITDGPDSFESMPRLIIDGKPITWEALGRMLAPYTGFRFKLEIFDRSEER